MTQNNSPIFDDFHETDCQLRYSLSHTGSAFFQSFGRFTDIQRSSIPLILEGNDVLLFSSTASGKTEAACAPLIERFIQEREPWTILYISPTRALINDLYYRLLKPTQLLNLSIKRRTSDHRDNLTQIPHILITTPESFDSIMCRNRRSDKYGHDLAFVKAIVLDEIHLLYGTPRGDQLKWLLQRLRKLRTYSVKNKWSDIDTLQTIGLSATLPNPQSIISDFFPENAQVVSSDRKRPIEIVNTNLESSSILPQILAYLNQSQQKEKILVFSKSRKRVDDLTSSLKSQLNKTGYEIYAHHGSLSKKLREDAEWAIKNKDRIILIATSTLEIGIDIGNIDLVILDGPPPDISSLLQRIGRGNRRTDKTRVMICAENLPDYILQHAMINAAQEGWLGEGKKGPNYAVIRQQIASYIYQGSRKKRSKKSLQDLFCSSTQLASIFQSILVRMIENEEIIEEKGGVLKLGDYWWKKAETMGMIHTNISSGGGYKVVDLDSGDVLANEVLFYEGKGLGVAGKNLEIKSRDSLKLEVRELINKGESKGKWKYYSQPFFVDSSQPQALKRYLNIEKNVWPIVQNGGFFYVFHCGGAIRNAMLTLLLKQYSSQAKGISCNEWYLKFPSLQNEKPSWMNTFHVEGLSLSLYSDERLLKQLESRLRRPKSSFFIPYDARVNEVLEWLNIESEEREIKNSIWINNLEGTAQETLRLYIQS